MAIFQADLKVDVAYDGSNITFTDNSNYGGTETSGGGAAVTLNSNVTSRVVRVYRTTDTVTPFQTLTFTAGLLTYVAAGSLLPSAAYRFEFEIVTTGVTLTNSQKQDYGVYPINVLEKSKYLKYVLQMKNSARLRDDKTYMKNLTLFAAELDLSDYMAELGDIQSSQDAIDRINNYVVKLF